MDVEDAADARHDLEQVDLLLPVLEDPHRQTGGVGESASGNAVLDAHAVTVGHRPGFNHVPTMT